VSTASLNAVALTTRMVPSDVRPLSARELWALSRHVDLSQPSSTLGNARMMVADADRVTTLLHRSIAVALALEQLDHGGIWTLTGFDNDYPSHLHEALQDDAPAVLHGAGNAALLAHPGLGIVGSRALSPEAVQAARTIAAAAAARGIPVVSGAAKGTDQQAMDGAFQAGGAAIGVLADSLVQTVSRPDNRLAVHDGKLVLLTPYAPSAGFTVGAAMARNKIIYGLSRAVVVIAADKDKGGTWAGAAEALKHRWGRVLVWTGPGTGTGNAGLVSLGATAVSTPDEVLIAARARPEQTHMSDSAGGHQLALEV
jgi:predicted Rossmann fold nucleotide-binding protein DprA/Smf involved in DNA uptake